MAPSPSRAASRTASLSLGRARSNSTVRAPGGGSARRVVDVASERSGWGERRRGRLILSRPTQRSGLAWWRGRERPFSGRVVVVRGRPHRLRPAPLAAPHHIIAHPGAFLPALRPASVTRAPPARRVLAGFARNLDWEVMATSPSPAPSVSLRLADTDATRAMWPHHFEVIYTVTLANDRCAPRRAARASAPRARAWPSRAGYAVALCSRRALRGCVLVRAILRAPGLLARLLAARGRGRRPRGQGGPRAL